MYKHILIPTDGSELAGKALTHGLAFAGAIGARVTVLTATEPFAVFSISPGMVEYTSETYAKLAETRAGAILDAAAAEASAAGVPCETVRIEASAPYAAIIEAATKRNCDLIVMASHGRRGISAIVLGSEAVKVLTHSKIPVLIYR